MAARIYLMSLLSRFWGEWFKSYGDTDFITAFVLLLFFQLFLFIPVALVFVILDGMVII